MGIQPTLHTERLILRPLVLEDFDPYVAFWQVPEVVRYISGKPIPRDSSWTRLLRTAGHWQFPGFGFFAIQDRVNGTLIGEAGFQEMRRDLVPSIEGTLETGWGLLPEYHGKGYASEAMGAAMEWAGKAHPTRNYTCIIDPENHASLRLAAKFGFVDAVPTSYLGKPVVILRRGAEKSSVP